MQYSHILEHWTISNKEVDLTNSTNMKSKILLSKKVIGLYIYCNIITFGGGCLYVVNGLEGYTVSH